jgi:hypothetical protein
VTFHFQSLHITGSTVREEMLKENIKYNALFGDPIPLIILEKLSRFPHPFNRIPSWYGKNLNNGANQGPGLVRGKFRELELVIVLFQNFNVHAFGVVCYHRLTVFLSSMDLVVVVDTKFLQLPCCTECKCCIS